MNGGYDGQLVEQVWREYGRAKRFNELIGLYETVEKNEDFYIGNQWRGVNAPDLDKPVMNVLARVVKFFIATIVSDDIGVSISDFEENGQEPLTQALSGRLDEIMEEVEFRKRAREVIRNAAVDGDGCLHYYFDAQGNCAGFGDQRGCIQAELIDNTQVHFGNVERADVQSQPYILLSFRKMREELFGADNALYEGTGRSEAHKEERVTVVRRYWKQQGQDGRSTVWFCDVTRDGVLREPTDTGLYRYPIAFFCWERVKGCFHGQAAITGMIPNQVFINKLFAMSMQHVKSMAFPKIIYNRTMMPEGWSNRVGEAIGVSGDPNLAVAANFRAQDMSSQVLAMIDKVIAYTRDTMGASDAVLGNVRPENASAIVATQQATSMPLELQKQDFYSFVEDSVRIWLDLMRVYYGVREIRVHCGEGAQEEMRTVWFDFSELNRRKLHLNVEIGAATYWSELMQVQTLDNLFQSGILQDAQVYLENMPRGYIPGKEKLLEAIRRQRRESSEASKEQTGG